MRKDMKKVLTERPRYGHQRSYHEIRSRELHGDNENMPFQQGMRAPHIRNYDGKEFSDLIGPLKRFLWTCIGRPWNDVWSEVCQNVPSNNTVDSHLKEHVLREVEINCYIGDDGEVYTKPYRRFYQSKPYGLYVDPRDGIIKANEKKKIEYEHNYDPMARGRNRVAYRRGENDILIPKGMKNIISKKYEDIIIKLYSDGKAALIDGIWYMFTYEQCRPPRITTLTDVETGKIITKTTNFPEFDQFYGYSVSTGFYHGNKRQIGSNELKRLGLINLK